MENFNAATNSLDYASVSSSPTSIKSDNSSTDTPLVINEENHSKTLLKKFGNDHCIINIPLNPIPTEFKESQINTFELESDNDVLDNNTFGDVGEEEFIKLMAPKVSINNDIHTFLPQAKKKT